MDEMALPALEARRFDPLVSAPQATGFTEALAVARSRFARNRFWHVNSTASGGGVAEMLRSVLGYLRGSQIDVRWVTIDGDDEFFAVTKRLHHLLHGEPGDGGELGGEERSVYERVLEPEAAAMAALAERGDVVVLHDPQTAGLAPAVAEAGVPVIWSCHVGTDLTNNETRRAWDFLRPYLETTRRQVFSRAAYAWEGLDPGRLSVIPPCIDAFSPKNQELAAGAVDAILSEAGVMPGAAADGAAPSFVREDGTPGRVSRQATMHEVAPIPAGAAIVAQISRWDRLKDHRGVMEACAVHANADLDAHLVLVGPSPDGVPDDPEDADVLEELVEAWRALPLGARQRVHIACLPMQDVEENAAVVNALQRKADVIVQKSLAEGFGLTVAEAMWKGRAVVGTRVGGIKDQIEDGVSGRLLDDPADLEALARTVDELLADPAARRRMGDAARQRVAQDYLAPCFLTRYLELATSLPT